MRLSLVVTLAAALAACSSAQPIPERATPTLLSETVALEERDQDLTGVTAVASVRLTNQGAAPVTASVARWELVVAGEVKKKGEQPLSAQVAPGGEATVEIPARWDYALTEEEREALAERKEPLQYALRGTVQAGADSVEFAKASAVRPPRPPKIRLETLEALSSPSQGFTVNASLEVENPNPFPLPIAGLEWKLSVDGKPLGEGVVARNVTAKPASTTQYELSVSLEPGEVARQGLTLGASVSWALEGGLQAGGARVDLSEQGEARLLRAGD